MRATLANRPPHALSRALRAAFTTGFAICAATSASAGGIGCAETPAPVAPVAPVVSTVPIATAPPAPPVDLAPVAEPADIVAVARWNSPNATLATLSSCAGIPESLADGEVRRLLDRVLGDALRGTASIDGKQLAETVAMDAPAFFVATLDAGRRGQPGALGAFSVGLTSLERARAMLEAVGPVVELQPGFWRVPAPQLAGTTCVIGPAAGAAPARLVCGPHDRDVIALGPYLVRNLPLAAPPAQDLHAELRFTPLDARFGAEIRRSVATLPSLVMLASIGEPRFDRALADVARAVSAEGVALVSDLDRVVVDVTVDPAACLASSLSLQLRNNTSWVAHTLAERATKAGPPPTIYWRAPVDSASAYDGRTGNGASTAAILGALRELALGKLAKLDVASDADRKALVALLDIPIGADVGYVVANGSSAPIAGDPRDPQTIVRRSLGWYLVGLDDAPKRLAKLLRDVASVYNRKGIQDALRKLDKGIPSMKLVPAPAKLGPGALDLEIHADIGSPSKPAGLSFHVLLMAEAKTTWLAAGADRDELVKRLLSAKTGAPEAGTLAARPGLEPLRSAKALSSGFFSIGAFTRGVTNVIANGSFAGNALLADLINTLQNLPHRGDTPIFVVSTASTASANAPRSDVSLNVQRGSFEDLGAILLTLHRIATNAGLRP